MEAIGLNNIIQQLEQEIQKYDKQAYYYEKDHLLKYFSKLVNSEKPKIHKSKTKEFVFTLRQFLSYKWLSVKDIFDILKTTDYHASKNKIGEKISEFYKLNLIKKTVPSPLPDNPREPYYKLTSYGLFYLLKDIEKGENIENIFKVHGNDDLFRIFIHPLIDKELLYSLQDKDIIGVFIEYAKQICNKISKELEVFKIIQKNGKYEEVALKWNSNLKNDTARWLEISDRLLSLYFGRPLYSFKKPLTLDEIFFGKPLSKELTRLPIENAIVRDTSISFGLHGNKYEIELDELNNNATLRINNIVVDSVTIKKNRNYFALYCLRYKSLDDYTNIVKGQFCFYIDEIIQRLVASLQLLYFKSWDQSGFLLFEDYRKKHEELEIIAKDEKIKILMIKFNHIMLKSFEGFLEYSD